MTSSVGQVGQILGHVDKLLGVVGQLLGHVDQFLRLVDQHQDQVGLFYVGLFISIDARAHELSW